MSFYSWETNRLDYVIKYSAAVAPLIPRRSWYPTRGYQRCPEIRNGERVSALFIANITHCIIFDDFISCFQNTREDFITRKALAITSLNGKEIQNTRQKFHVYLIAIQISDLIANIDNMRVFEVGYDGFRYSFLIPIDILRWVSLFTIFKYPTTGNFY